MFTVSLVQKFPLMILASIWCCHLMGQDPVLVWVDADGGDRNEYVYFQKSIQLTEIPTAAELHLYADSRYAFYVNGSYVNFGPSRSFHNNPYYDTYNLKPLLNTGDNCLVVKVLSNGMSTFQLYDYHGAFAAWGTVTVPSGNIDLSSSAWRCKTSAGYDTTMPRFSFATGGLENWDARKDVGWDVCDATARGWQDPVVLESSRWGKFRARPIPKLTQADIMARRTTAAMPLSDKEHLYSLRIATPDKTLKEYNLSYRALGYTYIHSERAQEVVMGLWWGDHYLNGKQLKPTPTAKKTNYRRNYRVKFKKGWNLFATKYKIIWGSWEFYMALPTNAGLSVSADQSKSESIWFKTILPTSPEDHQSYESIDLETGENDFEERFSKRFVVHAASANANHPVRDMVWKTTDTLTSLREQSLTNHGIELSLPETGVALWYEMEELQLGRFFVEGDFPKGTIIDIGFSEEPHPEGGPWLYKRYQVAAGLRFIADGKTKRYESFKPYGAKYLQVNLYNPSKTVRLGLVGMVRQVYPFQTVGSFISNDTLLNKIYEAGWRTLQICAEDSYTDTPFRERGLYAGDMLPEASVTMAMTGDMRLGRYSLHLFQDLYHDEMYQGKQNRHNDFPLITLLTADYLRKYTGDGQIISEYFENYASLLRHKLARKNGLGLIQSDRVFIEWTALIKEDAYMTAYQALLFKSLLILSDWAKQVKKPDEAAYFLKEASLLTKAINTHLWDEEKGMYFDGFKDGKVIDDHHLTSSIWPAFYGVADSTRLPTILTNLKTELKDIGDVSRQRKITPYSAFYLFSLLYGLEETLLADTFMKQHWAPMALHSKKPTTWENFDIDGEQGTSSHAWSGHPTYFLATATLGVNLGWYQNLNREIIEITPQSSHLKWAKGTVMHPSGPVSVAWQIQNNQLHLEYSAPKGKKVLVKPKGRLGKLPLKARVISHYN